MSFTIKLQHFTTGRRPSRLRSESVTNWCVGETIPIGPDRSLRVVEPGRELRRDPTSHPPGASGETPQMRRQSRLAKEAEAWSEQGKRAEHDSEPAESDSPEPEVEEARQLGVLRIVGIVEHLDAIADIRRRGGAG